jgi:putative transposase
MVEFIDQYRDQYGVEPISEELPIAPSTYRRYKALEREPEKCSSRVLRDEQLSSEIKRVWKESDRNYRARKVYKQLNRETIPIARCAVERLMKKLGLEEVRRGKRCITTIPSDLAHKPLDLVNREFTADRPNQLWVADITYVATWSGFVYVAFVIDVFSGYVIGWRVLKHMRTDLILDALEQAIWQRGKPKDVIHHSDRGSQYLSIRYANRLAEAGFNASVGSVGDSYDNALAETINELYKTEVIHKNGPWHGLDDIERATLTWVEWFNNRRLLRPIGDRSPAEYEIMYYQKTESSNVA